MPILRRFICCIAIVLTLNAVAAPNLFATEDGASSGGSVTKASPEDHAISTGKLPETEKSFWSRYGWGILGGLVLVAGGAAAAAGSGSSGGSSSSGGGSDDSEIAVTW